MRTKNDDEQASRVDDSQYIDRPSYRVNERGNSMKTVTSVDTRRPFDMPSSLAKLLQEAGVETRAPEVVGGMLFGALAHLSVGVATQFPEQWPIFRAAFVASCDDLRDVLTSESPAATVAGIMNRQHRDSGGKYAAGKAVDAVDPSAASTGKLATRV